MLQPRLCCGRQLKAPDSALLVRLQGQVVKTWTTLGHLSLSYEPVGHPPPHELTTAKGVCRTRHQNPLDSSSSSLPVSSLCPLFLLREQDTTSRGGEGLPSSSSSSQAGCLSARVIVQGLADVRIHYLQVIGSRPSLSNEDHPFSRGLVQLVLALFLFSFFFS